MFRNEIKILKEKKNKFPNIIVDITDSISARSSSSAAKKSDYEYDYDYSNSADHGSPPESKQSYVSGTGATKKTGYSAGSGLRSIAQGSADQAKSAVSNQHAAGKQAAYVAQVI